MRRLAFGLVLLGAAGCPASQSFLTARSLPKGDIQHTVGVEFLGVDYRNSDCAPDDEECLDPIGFAAVPWLAYAVRVGATDWMEVGGKYSTSGLLSLDLKFELFRSEYFDLAVDPGLSFTPGGALFTEDREDAVGIDAAFTYFFLPVLGSFNFGPVTITLQPRMSYMLLFSQSASFTDGLFLGGGVSIHWRVSDVVTLIPGFDYQVLTAPSNNSANFFSGGIAVSFGDQPQYETPSASQPSL
ncbi:MAG: hypothetical protein AAGF12_31385 [Myxococcota bacterium]